MKKIRKNRRSFQVIHQYQIIFSFVTSMIVLLCTVVYPIIINSYLNGFISLIDENSALRESFVEQKGQLVLWLVAFEIMIVVLTFYLTLRHSLRTVGPIMKTIGVLEKLSQGIPVEPIKFRRGDNFHELADYVNNLIESQSKFESSLRSQLENTVSMLAKANQRDDMDEAERKELINKSLESLREVSTLLIK